MSEAKKYDKAEWIGSSKKGLFDKYNELVETLNSETVVTTADVIATRETETNIATADSIVSSMDNIRKSVNATMDQLAAMSDQYQNLNAAITSKRTELKDILGFEVEANSTIALVTAKDALIADKTAEAANIIANAKSEATEIISAANVTAASVVADQKRKEAEWEYDFARTKKGASDELQDSLNLRVKAIDERVSAVKVREDEADAKDARIEALENEVLYVNETKEVDITTAIEAVKAEISKSAAISKGFSDRAHAQDLKMKDIEIAGLTDKVTDLSIQVSKSAELIANANSNVAEMAQAALKSQGDAATIAKVAEVAAGSSKNR